MAEFAAAIVAVAFIALLGWGRWLAYKEELARIAAGLPEQEDDCG